MKLEYRLFSVVIQVNKHSSWGLILTLAVVQLCSHWFIPVQAGLTCVVLRNLVFCVWYHPSATFIFFAEKGTLIHEKPFRVWGLFFFFYPDKDRSLSCQCSSTSKKWRSGIFISQHVFLSKKILSSWYI